MKMINYFSISGDSKQKKNIFSNKKVVVVPQLSEGVHTTKKYYFFDVAPNIHGVWKILPDLKF